MIRIIRTPKLFHGAKDEMALRTGFNEIKRMYFITVTDRKTGISCRIDMDEEYYNNFFYMGKFTLRQVVKNDVESLIKDAEKKEKGTGLH
jgi:hypothetical protein